MDSPIVKRIVRENISTPAGDQVTRSHQDLTPLDVTSAINAILHGYYEHDTRGHVTDYQLYQRFIKAWQANYTGRALPTRYQVRTALILQGYRFAFTYNTVRWVGLSLKKRR